LVDEQTHIIIMKKDTSRGKKKTPAGDDAGSFSIKTGKKRGPGGIQRKSTKGRSWIQRKRLVVKKKKLYIAWSWEKRGGRDQRGVEQNGIKNILPHFTQRKREISWVIRQGWEEKTMHREVAGSEGCAS